MAGLVATTLSGSQHDLSNGIQSPSLSYQLVDAVPKWSLLSRKWHGDISSLCTSQGMLLTLDRSWVPLLSGRASRCVLIYLQISKEICSQQVDNIINIYQEFTLKQCSYQWQCIDVEWTIFTLASLIAEPVRLELLIKLWIFWPVVTHRVTFHCHL